MDKRFEGTQVLGWFRPMVLRVTHVSSKTVACTDLLNTTIQQNCSVGSFPTEDGAGLIVFRCILA